MILAIFTFIPIIAILIFVHELGLYITAKFYGIKVLEFGFGPRRVSITSGSATLETDIVIGPASCLEGDPADQSANAKCA